MDTRVAPSPNKARKTVRSRGVAVSTLNINQFVPNTISSPVSNPVRKSARKSTGTCNVATNSNQINQLSRTRDSVGNSQNTTLLFPQPGCSKDPDSSDSDISPPPTQKILRRNATAPASKKIPAVLSSSSGPSTSEESEVEQSLKKKVEKKKKAESKAGKSLVDPSNLVYQCVFYILGANRSKKAIKKRDILQHVFEGQNTQMFPDVIKKAALMLQKTFGFELMELKSNKNEYLLVNKLCHQYGVQEFAQYSRMEHQKQGFIFYILTLIFMNENSILEDNLWKSLDPLGIEIKSHKPHPIFGDVQKFVTSNLVKQMYLERRQISKDPPQYELSWGERAHKEVLKEDLLDFVCEIMPETTPEEWILQYKDAKGRSLEGDAETEMD